MLERIRKYNHGGGAAIVAIAIGNYGASEGHSIVVGRDDRRVECWDSDERFIDSYSDRTHPIQSVAVCQSCCATSLRSQSFRIDGVHVQEVIHDPDPPQIEEEETARAEGINRIALGRPGGRLSVRSGGRETRPQVLVGHSDEIVALAFSGDGFTLGSVSRDRTLRFWDSEDGIQRGEVDIQSETPIALQHLDTSQEWLLIDREHGLRIFGTDGRVRYTFDLPEPETVTAAACCRQTSCVAFGRRDGSFDLWRISV